MDEERTVLPLKEAYRFGSEQGLDKEMAEIQDMEIEWDLSYTSSLRRGYIVDLFAKKGLFELFKKQYWPAGNIPWGQRKSDFWLRLKSRYEDFLEGKGEPDPEEEDAEEDQAFAAEADLRDFLANNLECIEDRLRLYQKSEQKGVEFPVDGGRIDILAVDQSNGFVVIELKLERGRNKATSLLHGMGR